MNWLVEKYGRWQEKRIASQAKRFQEYEKSIFRLFSRNKDACCYEMQRTKATLGTRSHVIDMVGNGLIAFLIQTTLAGIALLFGAYYSAQKQQTLPDSFSTVFWTLVFAGIFCIIVFCIIYKLMLHSYKVDRIKFEIQNSKLQQLLEEFR